MEPSKSPSLEEQYPDVDDQGRSNPPVDNDNQGECSHERFNPSGFMPQNEPGSTQHPPPHDENDVPQSYADRYADFASDTIPNFDDTTGDYSLTNLPNILFQLEAAVERNKRQNLGRIVVDGHVQYGQNGRAIADFPGMPRFLSYGLEGFAMEYYKRKDRTITYPDFTARMIDEEAVGWYRMNKDRKIARKEAEDAAKGKGKGKAKSGEEDQTAKPTLGMFGTSNLQKFHNSLNNRRIRDCRVPLGAISWEVRNTFPSKVECEAIQHLSEEQIRHNTTLDVTPQGLQRVRLEGQTGEKRKKITIPGGFLPLGFFLTNGQQHVPSERFQEARRIAADLNAKCAQRGLTNWDHLPTNELPDEWTGRVARGNATRMENKKRKLEVEEDSLAGNEEILPSVKHTTSKRSKTRKPTTKNDAPTNPNDVPTNPNDAHTNLSDLPPTATYPLGDGIAGPSTQPHTYRPEYPDIDEYGELVWVPRGYYSLPPGAPPPDLFPQDPTLGGPSMANPPNDDLNDQDPMGIYDDDDEYLPTDPTPIDPMLENIGNIVRGLHNTIVPPTDLDLTTQNEPQG